MIHSYHKKKKVTRTTICNGVIEHNARSNNDAQTHRYDAKADLWSVGTILFEMLCGRAPFTGANQIELLKNIETTEYRIPDSVHISEDADHLLRGLLQRNPLLRMSFEEFFSHTYLKIDKEEEKEEEKKEEEEKKMEEESCALPSESSKKVISNRTTPHLNVSSEYVIVPGT